MHNLMTPFLTILQSDSFECIGTECTDTCCAGWGVSIDKFTLENWNTDPTKINYTKYLKILPSPKEGELDAASVILEANGDCPFLNQQKLCSIQKEHSHESLSYVCQTFPRSKNQFYGIKEESKSLACPTAANLILGSESPLELNLQEIIPSKMEIFVSTTPNKKFWEPIPANTAWLLRTLVFKIIQLRKISLSNRLMILGILAKNLDDMAAAQNDNNCRQVISKFEDLIANPDTIKLLVKNIPNSSETKLAILRRLFLVIEPFTRASSDYSSYLQDLNISLKFNNPDDSEILQNYLDLNEKISLTDEQEKILENYCFQLVHKEIFPFASKSSLEQFLKLALRIFLIREHLKYSLRENEDLKTESIRLIQKFTRLYEHAPKLRETLNELLGGLGFNTLPHILIMLNAD